MSDIVTVDTDILIDADRNVQKAKLFLENIASDNKLAISEITVMELIIGCNNKNDLLSLEKFISQFTVYMLLTKEFPEKQLVY